jgi:TolB protein
VGGLSDPSWSPDGSRLAVIRFTGDTWYVAIVDALGGVPTDVVELHGPECPSWSPAGDALLVGATSERYEDILLMVGLDGSVTEIAAGVQGAWSPDGTVIAFVSRPPQQPDAVGTSRVMLMDATGTNVRELGGSPATQEHPAWSPDGRWIAYAGHDEDGGPFPDWGLYVQPADGGEARKIAGGLASAAFDWAP